MTKSLFAGAAALALIAGSAIAQEAYDSTTRTTTVTQPAPVYDTSTTRTTTVQQPTVIMPPPAATTTTVQRTVQPQYAPPPPPVSSSREEHVTTQDGQTVEHSVRTNTETPYGNRTTTYSQTTQSGNE
ncbi:MAG TPA: hypothetical protein VH722_17200 [Alphaproteobacteria bacterium]|jgi:hypothetical protein|nr:hypothetical protein [Alphaproteobacteria bacterium]